MARHGWTGSPRHVPCPALHVMANTVGRLKPAMGRQARAALAMDTLPTSRDTGLREELRDLPCTPVSRALENL